MASTCVCEKTKFIREIALCPSGEGGDHDSTSSLECENSWYELAGITSSVWSVSF